MSAGKKLSGLLVVSVVGLIVACTDGPSGLSSSPKLTSRSVLSGNLTVREITASSANVAPVSSVVPFSATSTGSDFSIALPGGNQGITVARIVPTSTDLAQAIQEATTTISVNTGKMPNGEPGTITTTRYGKRGPVTKLQIARRDTLVAELDYQWDPVEGGVLLRTQTISIYQDGKLARRVALDVHLTPQVASAFGLGQGKILERLLDAVLPAKAEAKSVEFNPATSSVSAAFDDGGCFGEFLSFLGAGIAAGVACAAGGPLDPSVSGPCSC